jgi:fructose-bisphosphate aldolase/2-amino-3,7-dideoxy-D-threo-hept-6-ulosonate synthase
MSTEGELLAMVYDSVQVGGTGVAIGRNIFQAENPTLLVRKLCAIVHQGWPVEEAERIKL